MVSRSAKLVKQGAELGWFAGAITRLNEPQSTLQHASQFSNVPEELIDAAIG